MPVTLDIDLGFCRPSATVHVPVTERDRHAAILYFHGGGLLYGDRDDLPSPYVRLLVDAGYTLYCLDYPLAPEAPLARIRSSIVDEWHWFVQRQMETHGFERYSLFGRSAGAYLALLLGADARAFPDAPQPSGIMSFYGFYDVSQPFFTQSDVTYAKLPAVPAKTVEALTDGEVLTNAAKELRFALYVHARQQGAWPELLGVDAREAARHSLSSAEIALLPPLFVTASTGDEDVPFGESKRLARTARNAVMRPVYDLEHDFDRNTKNPVGLSIYREAVAWLNGL